MQLISTLINNFGGMTFGVDSNGNYGYKKAGADTVTPFRSSGSVNETVFANGILAPGYTLSNLTNDGTCLYKAGTKNATITASISNIPIEKASLIKISGQYICSHSLNVISFRSTGNVSGSTTWGSTSRVSFNFILPIANTLSISIGSGDYLSYLYITSVEICS